MRFISPQRVAYRYLSREGKELSFTFQDITTDKDAERGWVLYRFEVFSDMGNEGYMKVSYIPKENWDKIYPDLLHYLKNYANRGSKPLGTPQMNAESLEDILDGTWGLLSGIQNDVLGFAEPRVRYVDMDPGTQKKWVKLALRVLRERYNWAYIKFENYHLDKPQVDYSKVNRKGLKVGASLYNYVAQWLARRGLALWSSSTQTPEAKRLWSVLEPNPGGHIGTQDDRMFLSYL